MKLKKRNINLDNTTYQRLREMAYKSHLSLSAIMRQIINQSYLLTQTGKANEEKIIL